ncbi:hypothetical protein SpCBS45565_g00353 [Spizellomyces sp. 'palustris']|nr:hypothetical protein SpCBS45565_g00353 [Spizellomyces sp. 'palustris']
MPRDSGTLRGTWVFKCENADTDYKICECGGRYLKIETPLGARSYRNHIRSQKHMNYLLQQGVEFVDPDTSLRLLQKPNYAPNQAPHSCTVAGCRGEVKEDFWEVTGQSENTQ